MVTSRVLLQKLHFKTVNLLLWYQRYDFYCLFHLMQRNFLHKMKNRFLSSFYSNILQQTLIELFGSVVPNNFRIDNKLNTFVFLQNNTHRRAYLLKYLFVSFKSSLFFKYCFLKDIVVQDRLGMKRRGGRFLINYIFSNLPGKSVINFLVDWDERCTLYSISNIFPAAAWLEREVWDMFGIRFRQHPDCRRLLTDYGFRGFPLRKDFPTIGFDQVRFDEKTQSCIYEPIKFMQEEREVNLVNPWGIVFQKDIILDVKKIFYLFFLQKQKKNAV